MKNIIWLASYPKSGNTWLRAFLTSYLDGAKEPLLLDRLTRFSAADASFVPYAAILGHSIEGYSSIDLQPYRKKAHEHISNETEGYAPVKTHNNYKNYDGSPAFFENTTRNAIYIVRNPLDMVISYGDHYGCGIQGGIEASLSSVNQILSKRDESVPQYLGNWSDHVNGWFDSGDLPRLILRYEDALRDPFRAFGQVVNFLKLDYSETILKNAIKYSSFNALKKQEEKNGFSEKSLNSKRFFRKGELGGWRKILTKNQVEMVLKHHGKTMRRLGYIRDDGSIVF
jgi:hypothetical protein